MHDVTVEAETHDSPPQAGAGAPPFYRWFPDGELTTCHNALDRHVEAGHGDRLALIYDSPVTGTGRRYTYAELRDEVARFAGVLRSLGVEQGDRVVVYLPMVPEAVIAMLACARLGAVHSVVFGGFALRELAVRIDDARPKVVVSASCGIEPGRVVPYKLNCGEPIFLLDFSIDACSPDCQIDLLSPKWSALCKMLIFATCLFPRHNSPCNLQP